MAAWKLGAHAARTGADGVDGTISSAFEYAFRRHRRRILAMPTEVPGTTQARFGASTDSWRSAAGYLDAIHQFGRRRSRYADRAREMFAYAASYFGDPDAQYQLGRMYLNGRGGLKEPKQAARWLLLAARKATGYQAQGSARRHAVQGWRRHPARCCQPDVAHAGARRRYAAETWIHPTSMRPPWKRQATEDERAVALVYLELAQGHRGDLAALQPGRVGKGGPDAAIWPRAKFRLCPRGPASRFYRVGKIKSFAHPDRELELDHSRHVIGRLFPAADPVLVDAGGGKPVGGQRRPSAGWSMRMPQFFCQALRPDSPRTL